MAVRTIQSTRQPPEQAQTSRGPGVAAGISPVRAQTAIGLLFLLALLAFEIFNFDTTRYALSDFLGDASFAGLRWATILAIAFGAIDFAGLVRFFLPEEDDGTTPVEVWYLMGAWLLGATMNALMTWWAVNLTLLNHDFGNEVLSRAQLLEIVPVFVALLVWLTRIFFIGAFTVAGGYLFDFDRMRPARALRKAEAKQKAPGAKRLMPEATQVFLRPLRRETEPEEFEPVTGEIPAFLRAEARESQGDLVADEAEEVPARGRRSGAAVGTAARVGQEVER